MRHGQYLPGDLLPAVAHPLPPAAGIAKGNEEAARASSAASSFPFAERGGFEPPEPTRSSTVFETAPFDHSGISPSLQIYAEAESNANEFIQFALPRRNSICGEAEYSQKLRAMQMNFSNPIKTFIRDFAMWK